MGMTRGTALVPDVVTVVKLTGQQDLANLEADGELTLTDLLVTASDTVYDWLEASGIDPTVVTNQSVFERAVAWQFLGLLATNGYLVPAGEDPQTVAQRHMAASKDHYGSVRARLSTGDEPRRPGEGIPVVGNIRRKGAFDTSDGPQGEFWNDRPRRV